MSIRVLSPGLSSSVQDLGRTGYRQFGVGLAGVMDGYSARVANGLVGNPHTAAVLEITLNGPVLLFETAATIAICGASLDACVGDDLIPCWRRIGLPAGSLLKLGHCRKGARAYLAIAGGFQVQSVLGSASTDLRSGFGGVDGRQLIAGDVLAGAGDGAPAWTKLDIASRWVDPVEDLDLDRVAVIRVLPGRDPLADPDALFKSDWQVDAASNRQGLRLNGTALAIASSEERVSEPVVPGTLQLPPDGLPIVLTADAQTHGGYPRIGHAILADQPRLAQLRPGERFHFAACSPTEARHALHLQQRRLTRIMIAMEVPARSRRG